VYCIRLQDGLEVKRAYYFLIGAVVAICVVGGVVFWVLTHEHISTGIPSGAAPYYYSYKIATLDTNLELPFFPTTQGATQQFNLTFAISEEQPKILLPIGDLNLTGYNSSRYDAVDWINWDWNSSIVQKSIFNYSLSQTSVVLQPGVANSTVLTLNWAKDAPTGRYTIDFPYQRFIFLESQAEYESFAMYQRLFIRVDPKAPQG
jgi:hypothetical protein